MLIMLSSYVNKTSMNKKVEKRKYRNSIIKQNCGESSLSFFLIKKLENWKLFFLAISLKFHYHLKVVYDYINICIR